MESMKQAVNNGSKNILTRVVDIVSGPYAGMTGTLGLATHLETAIVYLDPEHYFDAGQECAYIDGTFHVGLEERRTVRSVSVDRAEYRRMTEFEMIERFA